MALRVFLVDDLLSTQSLRREVFAAADGVTLVATASGEGEAKIWLEDHPGHWNVAVLDLVLEDGSGMGVIARCKETTPEGQVAIFSAHVTPVIRRHCLALGADAVFSREETSAFVQWLRERQPAQAAPA
jgi:DNA-binding NarL/FixJ family response regulator